MQKHDSPRSSKPPVRPDLARQLPVLLSIQNPGALRQPAEDVRFRIGPEYIIRDDRYDSHNGGYAALRCMDTPMFLTEGPKHTHGDGRSTEQQNDLPDLRVETLRSAEPDARAVSLAIAEIVKRLEPYT
jgi:hypothetical protein